MVERIFLEMKPAIGNSTIGGHLYLVKRDVPVDQAGKVLENNYSANDQVIRGSFGANLGTYAGAIGTSLDAYGPSDTTQSRHSVDITDFIQGGAARWAELTSYTVALNNQYLYELPAPGTEVPVANSNAVIFTVLAKAGVDIRNIPSAGFAGGGAPYVDSFFTFGAPGAALGTSTLLATDDITTATGLVGDVHVLGRDGNDTFINTSLNEKFYGGQSRTSELSATDTVKYNVSSSSPGVTLDASISGTISKSLRLSSESTGQDELSRIERVELTDQVDTLRVKSEITTKITIDAGASPTGQLDVLDFSARSGGVTLGSNGYKSVVEKGGAVSSSLLGTASYKNFEEIRLTSGNDTVKGVANAIIHTGGGSDRIQIASNGILGIDDIDYADRLFDSRGRMLTGGVKDKNSEDIYAYGQYGIKYARTADDTLVIYSGSGETYLKNFDFSVNTSQHKGGIYVLELEIKWIGFSSPVGFFLQATQKQDGLCEARKALYGDNGRTDPLVLDLDGDGVELISRTASSAYFDIDGDRFAEKVGWTTGDDGFLVRDINGNGKIDDISELFGNDMTSGFAHLALLDGNNDGKVSALDDGLADFNGDGQVDAADDFGDLKVWVDTNSDGITDAGELKSLGSLGIVSISTGATPTDLTVGDNAITETGTFERVDGTTGTIVDAHLSTNNYDSKYTGDSTVSQAAAALPNIKGHGTLTDLHIAMTLDPDLIEIVQEAISELDSPDLSSLRAGIRPILEQWVSAVPVAEGSPGTGPHGIFHFVADTGTSGGIIYDFLIARSDASGTYYGYASGQPVVDSEGALIARPTMADVLSSPPAHGAWTTFDSVEIAFLERLFGEELPFDEIATNPTAEQAAAITDILKVGFNELNLVAVRLAAQGPLASFFQGIAYDVEGEKFLPTTGQQLTPMLEAIFDHAPTTAAEAMDYLSQWKDVFNIVMQSFQRDEFGRVVSNPYLFQHIAAAYENSDLPLTLEQAASVLDISAEFIVSGAGTLTGTNNTDLFYLGLGDQIARGGAAGDTYVVGRDFGHDTIQDVYAALGDSQEDSLRFAHLNADELSFVRDGVDLIIRQNGTSNELRIIDEFAGRRPGLFLGFIDFDTSVEIISFADGTTWNKTDIARAAGINSYSTDDAIYGTNDVNFLNGGGGNDFLSGGSNGDHYLFGRGDGHDTIQDDLGYILLDDDDYLHFGPGITRDDVTFRLVPDLSLEVSINGTDDVVRVVGQYDVSYNIFTFALNRIEVFTFDDGSYITYEQLLQDLLADAKTAGDDVIYGADYEDVLDGGVGNDVLAGGNENDTYVFGKGYGSDVIREQTTDVLSGETDTLLFTEDVLPADVSFSRDVDSGDLRITLSSGDTLVIEGQFSKAGVGGFLQRVEVFKFSSTGEVLSFDDVMDRLLSEAKTEGNDSIYGFSRADVLDGGAGDDFLSGGSFEDTYIFGKGYGADVIRDNISNVLDPDFDTVLFKDDILPEDVTFTRVGNSNDLLITLSTGETLLIKDQFYRGAITGYLDRIEQFKFSSTGETLSHEDIMVRLLAEARTDGDDTIYGFQREDILDGGRGNDTLDGGDLSDTYVWSRGDGNDTIVESAFTSGVDKVVLHGVNAAAVSLERVGSTDDILLTIAPSTPGGADGGTILLKDTFVEYFDQGIEQVVFDDGTVWDRHYLRTIGNTMAIATSGDDVILGSVGANFIEGFEGNDTLDGRGGNDTLIGGNGNDTLIGGLDDDNLQGEYGSDTYRYASGDGNDIIADNGDGSDRDTLILTNLNAADVTFVRRSADTDDLLIRIKATGEVVTVDRHFDTASHGIEQIQFANGSALDRAAIEAATAFEGTAGNDTFFTSGAANKILGLGGDDDISTNDGNDELTGGTGNDTLRGGAGSDAYFYASGDGNDLIVDSGDAAEADKLVFTDLNQAGVRFTRAGDNLIVTVLAAGGVITVKDHYFSNNLFGLKQVQFADGSTLDRAGIAAATAIQGSSGNDDLSGGFGSDKIFGLAGNDTISASDGNDELTGGTGDDTLRGGSGSDTYFYASGDGNDLIVDFGDATETDKLALTDLNQSAVRLTRAGDNLTVRVLATTETIVVRDHFYSNNLFGLKQLQFADGSTLDRAGIAAATAIEGSSGNDDLSGGNGADKAFGLAGNDTISTNDGNDELTGGMGNDTLRGGAGSDAYFYASGDGNDLIIDSGSSTEADKLVLTDLNQANVQFTRSNDDLVVTVLSTSEAITVRDHFFSNNLSGLKQLQFASGLVLDRAGIAALVVSAGSAQDDSFFTGDDPDTVYGFAGNDFISTAGGNDIMSGGTGNDTLRSNGGSDTYLYARGDGTDYIDDESPSRTDIDILRFADLNASDISLTRSGVHSIITINATGDKITLDEQFYNSDFWGIEKIEFANGTFWDRADIQQNSWIRGTSGNDTLFGTDGNDTYVGALGDDSLRSGTGSDTFIYASGDGNDYIDEENPSTTAIDVLKFTDLNASDISLTRSGVHSVVTVNATGQTITLDEQFYNSDHWGIDRFEFANGQTWNRTDIQENSVFRGGSGNDSISATSLNDRMDGGAGNDTLSGQDGNDILVGGAGNDSLTGGAGRDSFVFKAGFGQDSITDFSLSATTGDHLQFDTSVFADFSDVIAHATQVGADAVIADGSGNTITLQNVNLTQLTQDHLWFV